MGIRRLASGKWRLQIRRKNLQVDELYDSEPEAKEALGKYTHASGKSREDMTLEEAWELYAKSLEYASKRERTKDTEASRIKRLLDKYGTLAVSAFSADLVEGYITKRLKDTPKPSSDAIRLEVASLSALMNFCRKKRLIAANPCIGVQRPAAASTPRRLLQEDEGALISLLSHSNPRFRFAARLCLLVRETGARPGEWGGATYNDIDFSKNTITFRNTKYKKQPRTVPLTAAAARLLTSQLQDVVIDNFETFGNTDVIFPAVGQDGEVRPMHYTGALRDIKKKGLLNKRVRAHTGRHEFISTLVESTDLDDSRIMSLVGHHSPASMEVYKHVRNVRFRPQIEEIEPARRTQRVGSLATALDLPQKVIEMMLLHEREKLAEEGLDDGGDELLFDSEFIQRINMLNVRAGNTPHERLQTLIRLREELLKAMGFTQPGKPNPGPDLTNIIEASSIGASHVPQADTDHVLGLLDNALKALKKEKR
ncbi:MAG: tyrosine-type recombinase/integrase [Thiobacillus sp.]|nr:tyrosine-type recombinase/integrase [Thiobacillus sp.]